MFDPSSGEFFLGNIEAEILAAVDDFDFLFEGVTDANDEMTRKMIENSIKRFKADDEANKKTEASFEDYLNFAGGITDRFTKLFTAQKEKELSIVGDNAEKREEIEKKFARREQLLAISKAVLDGASSIQKTKAQLPE